MSKILAKCCGTILESRHRHDFRRCACRKVYVDGGNDYLRCGWPGGNPNDYIEVLEDAKRDTKHDS